MFRRKRSASDFDEEIQAHLALEADELEARGVPEDEAQRRARVTFGSVAVARERFNLRGHAAWLDDLLQDVRFGVRMMQRKPAFSAVAVLILAVGIGACATVFSWIDGILLQPLTALRNDDILFQVQQLPVFRPGAQSFQIVVRPESLVISKTQFGRLAQEVARAGEVLVL